MSKLDEILDAIDDRLQLHDGKMILRLFYSEIIRTKIAMYLLGGK